MAKHNWIKIRTKYVTSREPISYAKLAELYELNETTIAERASKEGWVALRQQTQEITQQKTIELTTSTISSYNAHKFLQGQQVADKAVTVLLDPNIKIGGKVANEMLLAGHKLQTEALGLDNPKIAIQNNNIQNNIMSLDDFMRKMKDGEHTGTISTNQE
jgi:hypothetical protein